MEQYDLKFRKAWKPAWEDVPSQAKRRIFGVDYVCIEGKQGGALYFTWYGWQMAASLIPRHWYTDEKYRSLGQRLTGSTGTVYHVPHSGINGSRLDLVVKFSRMAQHPGFLDIWSGVKYWSRTVSFLSPFEEFGNLYKLRGRGSYRIPTKTPLAIYSPPTHFPLWNLGRESSRLWRYDHRLRSDQETSPYQPIHYEWERDYILLYRWIDGIDAEEAAEAGALTKEQLSEFTWKVDGELAERGFVVLDHKPKHLIVRLDRQGRLRRTRDNEILYALIDYELLVPREN